VLPEVGEMESFCKTIEESKMKWVEEVLKRNFMNDPDLEAARNFAKMVASLIGMPKLEPSGSLPN
jgi:hypothetical protein